MSSECPGKNAWPELVGTNGDYAAAVIERENRRVDAIVILDGTPVTADFREELMAGACGNKWRLCGFGDRKREHESGSSRSFGWICGDSSFMCNRGRRCVSGKGMKVMVKVAGVEAVESKECVSSVADLELF
ncbi:hypothetical protein Bca4012_017950 [Brassica carinata]